MIGQKYKVMTCKYGFIYGEIVTAKSEKFKQRSEYYSMVETSNLQVKKTATKYLKEYK